MSNVKLIKRDNVMIETKTLVIGFGFSTLPLYRELDRTGDEYLIISDKIPTPIWAELKNGGNLDFDLVSSYHTSFYSFNIVKDFKTDYYTPAKEYYSMHLEYQEKYKDKIIPDHVTHIENHDGYSIVHTESGTTYKATNVVIATNFKRRILDPLATFDFPNIKNKTIVFNMIGDSVNLMIAKLIAGNNKIIILSDGFIALDKMFEHKGKTITIDQLEFHNVSHYLKYYYMVNIVSPIWRLLSMSRTLENKGYKIGKFLFKTFLMIGKILSPNQFSIAYPDTIRAYDIKASKLAKARPMSNGIIIIKYWGIETYQSLFGKNIEENIEKGYLLNDLPFFIDQGVVQCFRKSDTIVDQNNKTIKNKGEVIKFDYFVEGSMEAPKCPPIKIERISNGTDKNPEEYTYVYRDNYFGSIPKKLSNVFFVGWTRPSTGGLGNLTEMQCLLIHKMIHNEKFKNEIYSSINERLDEYNAINYLSDVNTPSDHLVPYGFFTDDVAKAIGIDIKLKDSRSIKDIMKYFLFPNNAFKYRQKGEYKVDGCDKLVDHIYKEHKGFSIFAMRIFVYYLYQLMLYTFFIKLYLYNMIGIPVLVISLLLVYFFRFLIFFHLDYTFPLLTVSFYNYLRLTYIVAGAVCLAIFNPLIFIPFVAIDTLWTILVRAIKPESSFVTFNDLRVKRKYKDFFARYIKAYRKAKMGEVE